MLQIYEKFYEASLKPMCRDWDCLGLSDLIIIDIFLIFGSTVSKDPNYGCVKNIQNLDLEM